MITPKARQIIYSWLGDARADVGLDAHYDALYIAALKALEQVGDAKAIPPVKRLSKITAQTPGALRVRQAAIDCLPTLRAHCGEVETARVLLRASQAGEARPDTLLRPATGAEETNSAGLLRGAEKPDAPQAPL